MADSNIFNQYIQSLQYQQMVSSPYFLGSGFAATLLPYNTESADPFTCDDLILLAEEMENETEAV